VRYVLVKVPPVPRTPEGWAAAEALALKARTGLEAGKPIDQVVREISTPAWTAVGGELGTVHKGQLQAELDALVWRLPERGISKPVRAFEGVYVVQVEAFLPSRQVPFEETEDKIRAQLTASQRRERIERWRKRLREEARIEIGLIKVMGAQMLHNVIDRAIQVYGAKGVTEDTPLEGMYRRARFARIYDGPDEVHVMSTARRLLRSYEVGDGWDFGLR